MGAAHPGGTHAATRATSRQPPDSWRSIAGSTGPSARTAVDGSGQATSDRACRRTTSRRCPRGATCSDRCVCCASRATRDGTSSATRTWHGAAVAARHGRTRGDPDAEGWRHRAWPGGAEVTPRLCVLCGGPTERRPQRRAGGPPPRYCASCEQHSTRPCLACGADMPALKRYGHGNGLRPRTVCSESCRRQLAAAAPRRRPTLASGASCACGAFVPPGRRRFCSQSCSARERALRERVARDASRSQKPERICACGLLWERCVRQRETPERRMRRTKAWRDHVRFTLSAHRAQYGDWCPGYRRDGHEADRLTVDHITPLSVGGALLGPTQVLCQGCNSRKSRWDGSREVAEQRRRDRSSPVRHGLRLRATRQEHAARRKAEREAIQARKAERERQALERVAANARTCTVCGAAFIKQTGNPGLYCSNTCKGVARRPRPGQGDLSCARCGQTFASAASGARYCSKRCSKAEQKRRARERARHPGRTPHFPGPIDSTLR